MTRLVAVALAGCLIVAAGIAGAFLFAKMRREDRLLARLQAIHSVNNVVARQSDVAAGWRLKGPVIWLGLAIARSGLLSEKTVDGLTATLAAAGLKGRSALGLFVGAKLLLLPLLPLLAYAALRELGTGALWRNIALAAAAMVGLLGPDWWVKRKHKTYLRAVSAGLSDALDMLVICAEAGLSFEPAIARVGREIAAAHPAVASEFAQTASELRMVADSRIALLNLGQRTGLDSLKRMAAVLTQTMQYGTPLGDALRVLSAEMRHELLMRFETRAARLPVLLTLPMIIFILPCVFLVVGGPAVIQVLNSMRQ